MAMPSNNVMSSLSSGVIAGIVIIGLISLIIVYSVSSYLKCQKQKNTEEDSEEANHSNIRGNWNDGIETEL